MFVRRLALAVALVVLGSPFDSNSGRVATGILAQGNSQRILAIGDIHGSISGLTSILKIGGLIDQNNKWIGGRAQLLQTGDYTDRGEDVRAVLDLLMAIEPQAKDAGGRAFTLLGNHEVMNLLGETRDATAQIYARFADAKSAARREDGWKAYQAIGAARAPKDGRVPPPYTLSREQFIEAHPLGYLEYREALGPKGKYGQWLRGKPMVAAYGGAIFMHAGINPAMAPEKIDDLNDKLREEIRRMDRFVQRAVDKKLALPFFTLQEMVQVAVNEVNMVGAMLALAKAEGTEVDRSKIDVPFVTDAQEVLKADTWLSLDPEAALWYRGLATVPDDATGGPFALLLKKYGQQRFVTGHTPTQDRRINVRFGGRAILIDTGMLTPVYKGRASMLEMIGNQLTAIYEDEKVPIK